MDGTRTLLRALARLPLRWVHGVGAAIGWLGTWVPNEHRRVAERNLAVCFPELSAGDRRRLLRDAMAETGKTLTEIATLWLADPRYVEALVQEVRGEALLREPISQGRGVILLSPHLGAWEMIGQYIGPRYPLTCMYRPPRQVRFDGLVRESRQRTGTRVVPIDAGGIRALYETLRKGQMVGILPDQDPRDPQGAFAPFFGTLANTMTLVPRLANKTGAAVVFGFAERLPRGQGYRLHFLPAPEGIADPDPVIAATAMNKGVEDCVRLVPAQYQWTYKRFRTRPAGERAVYGRDSGR